MVEVECPVPGNFTLVDHAIFRTEKGAVGFLKVRTTGIHASQGHSGIPLDHPAPCWQRIAGVRSLSRMPCRAVCKRLELQEIVSHQRTGARILSGPFPVRG